MEWKVVSKKFNTINVIRTEVVTDKEKERKTVWKTKNFCISTYNRFSILKHDITKKDVDSPSKIEKIHEKRVRKHKMPCRILEESETKKTFCIYEKSTVDKIQKLPSSEKEPEIFPSQKRKCKWCGYKKNCNSKGCKAQFKICTACSKQNHFPRSPNCKLRSKLKHGCINHTDYLKFIMIITNIIPYKKLSEMSKMKIENIRRKKASKLVNNDITRKQIEDRIFQIETDIKMTSMQLDKNKCNTDMTMDCQDDRPSTETKPNLIKQTNFIEKE